jgi:Fe-S cluster assembly protein SufD
VRLDQAAFERAVADDPAWLADLRKQGFDYFEKLPMPTGAEEEWRYVDLDFELTDLTLRTEPGDDLGAHPILSSITAPAGVARIIDGVTDRVENGSGGTLFTSHRTAFREHEAEMRGAYGQTILPDVDIFAAAHRAFSDDGIFLYVPPNKAVEQPFVIDVQSTKGDSISFPHITVVVEENGQASVVVLFRSPSGSRIVTSPQLELSVRDGARLSLVTVQDWGYDTRSVIHQRMVLGRDATGRLGEVGLGARLGRLDLDVDLLGDGGSSELAGIYFGDRDQVLDYRVVINHHGRNTSSDIFLKGAVEDQAKSVFTGLLKIWPDATRTSTFETNRNLVLSDGAKAHSVPNLEILCDDVMCGHGSTVGPLEEEHLYYLMSRGLSEERASRVLVRGFFEEMIGRLPIGDLADPVREAVNGKYLAALGEGRV